MADVTIKLERHAVPALELFYKDGESLIQVPHHSNLEAAVAEFVATDMYNSMYWYQSAAYAEDKYFIIRSPDVPMECTGDKSVPILGDGMYVNEAEIFELDNVPI